MKSLISLILIICSLALSDAAKSQAQEGWDARTIAEVKGYCVSGIVGAAAEGFAIYKRKNGISKSFPKDAVKIPVEKLCNCFSRTASENVAYKKFQAETLFIKIFNESIDNGTCKPEGILKVILDRFSSSTEEQ